MSPGSVALVGGLIVLLPLSLIGVRDHWNANNTYFTEDEPDGWPWGPYLWAGYLRAVPVIVVGFALTAVGLGAFKLWSDGPVGRTAGFATLAVIVVACVLTLAIVVLKRPKALIPPHLRG